MVIVMDTYGFDNVVEKIRYDDIKQVILINTGLGMKKGKMVAQGSHASLQAALKTKALYPNIYSKWMEKGFKKVVLRISDEYDMVDINMKIIHSQDLIETAIICDQGLTQVLPGSFTALAIGPHYSSRIDKYTKDLRLL